MANYREHITVSSLLGLGYGLGAVMAFRFTPLQGVLAACFTGVAGMLPDLDSDNGRPVREMFGLLGAVAPLLLVNRVVAALGLPGDPETIMLVIVALYVLIRYGGAALVSRLSVHRGMFHSLPALIIAAEAVYLAYPGPRPEVRLLMAGGVALGFLSHLLLDELHSVHVKDRRLQLKRSSGTALKWSGDRIIPNAFSYTLMLTLAYAVLLEAGWFDQQSTGGPPRSLIQHPTGGADGNGLPGAASAVELGAPAELRTVTGSGDWERSATSPPAGWSPLPVAADPGFPGAQAR